MSPIFFPKTIGVKAVFYFLDEFSQKSCILRDRLKQNFAKIFAFFGSERNAKINFAKNAKFSQNGFSFLQQTLVCTFEWLTYITFCINLIRHLKINLFFKPHIL